MKQIFYILVFSFPVLLTAQTAPDFTVTNIQGQSLSLFSQYLSQGKTVMLKIFYSTCPPCNSQAASVQSLYEEWGSGDHDVEFIEVSNKTWETNTTAGNYVNNHGLTFPTVSATGGSLNVISDYVAAFGGYNGTPAYIVISPAGIVNWDLEFSEIEPALLATGATKPGTSGVGDVNLKEDLWIAPNPSTDFLDVYSKSVLNGNVSVSVYNILGGKLYEFNPKMQDRQLLHVEVNNWNAGTYLVRIESAGKVLKTMRFVKR